MRAVTTLSPIVMGSSSSPALPNSDIMRPFVYFPSDLCSFSSPATLTAWRGVYASRARNPICVLEMAVTGFVDRDNGGRSSSWRSARTRPVLSGAISSWETPAVLRAAFRLSSLSPTTPSTHLSRTASSALVTLERNRLSYASFGPAIELTVLPMHAATICRARSSPWIVVLGKMYEELAASRAATPQNAMTAPSHEIQHAMGAFIRRSRSSPRRNTRTSRSSEPYVVAATSTRTVFVEARSLSNSDREMLPKPATSRNVRDRMPSLFGDGGTKNTFFALCDASDNVGVGTSTPGAASAIDIVFVAKILRGRMSARQRLTP